MRRRPTAAAASLLLAVGGVVVTPVLAPAAAAPTPAPRPAAKPAPRSSTPTLPVPRGTVDPRLSVGGARLASMGVVLDRPASVPPPPALKDVSWVLADLGTGDVLAAKAAHARLLPASTLKTLTALTLIPRVDPARPYRATAADANADGTRVGLLPGQSYTGAQLFSALLMASGNDAAYALARVGGGREATLAAMNAEARRLGAHDTVARDPAGLDAPGQTSSAYDLALIGRAALQLPAFRSYVATRQLPFPGRAGKNGKRPSYVISNHNLLLYNYPGTIGVKNGYTRAAKRTYVSAVRRGGRTYLLTEMYGLDAGWRPQAAMYDWAFRYGNRLTPVGRLVEPGTVTDPPSLPPPARTTTAAAATAPRTERPDPASSTGGPARDAAAAAIPAWGRSRDSLAPWVGMAALGGAGLLVALFAARAVARRPRGH